MKKIITLRDLYLYLADTRGEEYAKGVMQGWEARCPDREVVWQADLSGPDEEEPMPEVYYKVKEIITRLDLKFVNKIYLTTPPAPARWEKLIGIPDKTLEDLLFKMDSYVQAKRKRYKDLTLVLNNWYKRDLKRNPSQSTDYDNDYFKDHGQRGDW